MGGGLSWLRGSQSSVAPHHADAIKGDADATGSTVPPSPTSPADGNPVGPHGLGLMSQGQMEGFVGAILSHRNRPDAGRTPGDQATEAEARAAHNRAQSRWNEAQRAKAAGKAGKAGDGKAADGKAGKNGKGYVE